MYVALYTFIYMRSGPWLKTMIGTMFLMFKAKKKAVISRLTGIKAQHTPKIDSI